MRALVSILIAVITLAAHAQPPAQPLVHNARNIQQCRRFLGSPLPPDVTAGLEEAYALEDDAEASQRVQELLDPLCLVHVTINPEARVKARRGAAKARLVQDDWRLFLVRVDNQAGVTAPLGVASPNRVGGEGPERERWMDAVIYHEYPAPHTLTGFDVEYRILQVYSRDAGRRMATLSFDVGQGTQDLGFRSDVDVLFEATPSYTVTLGVKDHDGSPIIASITFRDESGRVHPSPARRVEPDFRFQPQVYRADGETVSLPNGRYSVEARRGPEYHPTMTELVVDGEPTRLDVTMKRWIDPSTRGYWSGDHHIHAAGCAHYTDPTLGVHADAMARHCVGEDLKVGANLTWGPCFDYQKQFFTGKIDEVSSYPYLLRYDIEVSGFGSHRSGHLCLLRLREQMYPGGDSKEHWPTLGLSTLRWAQAQGAVCGPAHSAFGLAYEGTDLPNYDIPAFDNIGANEYIVDVTHMVPGPDGELVPAVDFMSTVDTNALFELNIWYHTLNCGYRTRISGETDFPCLTGARVGEGRSYVKLDGKLDYDAWCEGIGLGRNYVSDGWSHLMDFTVHGVEVGTQDSEVRLDAPGTVRIMADVAVWLDEQPNRGIGPEFHDRPYWHAEKARIEGTRKVPVELVVNGRPVARREIVADGMIRPVQLDAEIERSSWVTLRVLPSAHTNPVFVIVGDEPIRASRRSARWCLHSVDRCWQSKKRSYDPEEMDDARAAYDHARNAYAAILDECEVD